MAYVSFPRGAPPPPRSDPRRPPPASPARWSSDYCFRRSGKGAEVTIYYHGTVRGQGRLLEARRYDAIIEVYPRGELAVIGKCTAAAKNAISIGQKGSLVHFPTAIGSQQIGVGSRDRYGIGAQIQRCRISGKNR